MAARFSLKAVREGLTTRFIGRRLEYRAALSSTQDLARRLAEGGAAEGTVVLAGRQTAGRGRLGRSWVSPRGGLYLTIVLRPRLEQLGALAMACPLAVAWAVEKVTGLSSRLKWPNDVLVGGAKICGCLIEAQTVGQQVDYALAGIGVNVNMDMAAYPQIAAVATSLMMELGRQVSPDALAAEILNQFEALYLASEAPEGLREEWRARLETLGKQVEVRFGQQTEEGLAEDVDAQGNLILRRADGSRLTIAAGDVTLRE